MMRIDLPAFEAEWRPLRMETIPGSGELITVAIAVQASSGQSSIRQSVQPAVFSTLFGPAAGKGVGLMVVQTIVAIQRQLDSGVALENIIPPYGGFDFGGPRDCLARDLNEVFDVAIRLSSAFGQSAYGQQNETSESSRQAFNDWAERVRIALLRRETVVAQETVDSFNVKLKVGGRNLRFGVLKHSYAANFGVLRPGHISGDIRSLKVKVFDLQGLQREQAITIDRADVVVGCPADAAMESFSRREVENFKESVHFIELESKARGVRLVRCDTAENAARHVATALLAA